MTPSKPPALSAEAEAEQDRVLASGSAYECYLFAWDNLGADIPALQKVVLEAEQPLWCYLFAYDITGVDAIPLARVAVRGANPEEKLQSLVSKYPDTFTPEVLADLSLGVTF